MMELSLKDINFQIKVFKVIIFTSFYFLRDNSAITIANLIDTLLTMQFNYKEQVMRDALFLSILSFINFHANDLKEALPASSISQIRQMMQKVFRYEVYTEAKNVL